MKLPAFVLMAALTPAAVFAQAMVEYGGALAPATAGVGARPIARDIHIHHNPAVRTDARTARPQSHSNQTARKSSHAMAANTAGAATAVEESPAKPKSIAEPGGVSIQR